MLRNAISNQESSGTTRQQPNDQPCSYHETLGCLRYQYERIDVKKKTVVKETLCAEASWADAMSTADRLKHVSDLALTMELNRRGYEVAGKVLQTKKHKSK